MRKLSVDFLRRCGQESGMTPDDLLSIVSELATRPGHEKVRGLLFKLLTDGLGAKSADITFEHQTFEIRGRIDALLGRTVIEVKSDLRSVGVCSWPFAASVQIQ
jgi:hypothetical protein